MPQSRADASIVLTPTTVRRSRSPSTARTVRAMEASAKSDQAHPLVRAFAGRAIEAADAQAGGRSRASQLDVVKAVEQQVAAEVRFVQDPVNVELIQSPSYLLSLPHRNLGSPIGDCDEMATLAASALMSVGLDPSFVRLAWTASGKDPFAHVLLQVPVEVAGRRVPLLVDPSYHGPLENLVQRAAWAFVHPPVSRATNQAEHLP